MRAATADSHALFVHIPSEETLPHAAALAAARDLIQFIAEGLRSGALTAKPSSAPAPRLGAAIADVGKSGGLLAGSGAAAAVIHTLVEELGFEDGAAARAVASLVSQGSVPNVDAAVAALLEEQEGGSGGGGGGVTLTASSPSAVSNLAAELATLAGAAGALAAPPRLKLVIILRGDVAMSAGKAAAQSAHAALKAARMTQNKQLLREWRDAGEPIIVLRGAGTAEDEGGLPALARAATDSGVLASAVRDAGRTQVAAGTWTALALGPATEPSLDVLTGSLRLY